MPKRKAFLIVQAILCALVAVFLAAGALTMYFDGAEKQAQGDAVSIYTREKVSAKLMPVLPLMCLSLGGTYDRKSHKQRTDTGKSFLVHLNLIIGKIAYNDTV